jgi:acyl-CoA reductase-like NAD-dependent aldehyde dehydrogenase
VTEANVEAENGKASRASALDTPLIEDGMIRGLRPTDDEPLSEVQVTAPSQIPELVARARKAQAAHAARSVDERAKLLNAFKNAILRRGDALTKALMAETGKPEPEAWLHDVVPTADLAAYWSVEGPLLLAAVEPTLDALNYPGKHAVVERLPRGVIALITPWNFPVALPLRTIFPALLAGNAVILKPSEHAPRSAAILGEAAREVFGEDLLIVAQGGGNVGAAIIEAGVDSIVFTGSVATGRKVAHAAAEALIPVSLELGGKDPAIVLDDADVERAARGILWGAFANSGQNCAAIERVYATPKIAGPLEKRLAELAAELVPGRDFGPLCNRRQLAIVEKQVEAAKAAGAEVLAGGERLDKPGLWYAATVLRNVPSDQAALTEETFGPMVPVTTVSDEAAAIVAANSSPYGLTASVWTKNIRKGEEVARQLRAGVVMVNNHGFTGAIPSLPWSGVGDSGFGVTNSAHALDALTRPRAVIVDRRRAKQEMWWHPYTDGLSSIGRNMAVIRGGGGWVARIKAVFALLGAFASRWKT